jgi:hypothetical protein
LFPTVVVAPQQGRFDGCEMYDYGVLPDPYTVDPDHFNLSTEYDEDALSTVRRIACTSWSFDSTFFVHTVQAQVRLRSTILLYVICCARPGCSQSFLSLSLSISLSPSLSGSLVGNPHRSFLLKNNEFLCTRIICQIQARSAGA